MVRSDEQIARMNAVALQGVHATEQPLLVADVIPGGVEPPHLEGVIVEGMEASALPTRLRSLRTLMPLVEADLEAAGPDLINACLP
jgi:hypothetical protein